MNKVVLLLLWPMLSISQGDFVSDSLAVRSILDTNGLKLVSVFDVADSANGRINSFNLVNRKISVIPEIIGTLSELISLNLSQNNINSLPNDIGSLQKLAFLGIGANNLSQLPDSIVNLVNLNTLSCGRNSLSEIPVSLTRLPNLSHLWLENNQITNLNDSLVRMSKLDLLSLDSNKITLLPDYVTELTQLEYLSLSMNQLQALPDSIGRLKHLFSFNVSGNKISSLPNSIMRLDFTFRLNDSTHTHKALDLNWNQLCSLSPELTQWADTNCYAWNHTQSCSSNLEKTVFCDNRVDVTPNPFKSCIEISYNMLLPGRIKLNIYDIKGCLIGNIEDSYQYPGFHRTHWQVAANNNGIYLVKIRLNNFLFVKKIVCVK